MTTGEFDLLWRLYVNGPQTPGELASYGSLKQDSHQLVTVNLQRLALRSFVQRGPTGIWHLTKRAEELLAL